MKTRILISLLIVSLIFTSIGLILPQNAIGQTPQTQLQNLVNQYSRVQLQKSQTQLQNLVNQYNNLNLSGLTSQLNNLSAQIPQNLSGQYNNLLGNLNGLNNQFSGLMNQLNGINLNNLSSSLAGSLLNNLSGQFNNLTGQLGGLTDQFSNLTGQLGGALQGQLGNLTGQLGNLTSSLGGLTGSLGGLSGSLMSGGGGGGGGGGSSKSVPVYETNKDMLSDIDTTANKTTDILKQMQMEWDFFRNNEKSKMEYFKKTQDKVQEYLQKDKEGNSRVIENWIDFITSPGLKAAKVFHEELEEDFLCETFNEQIKQMFNPEKRVKFSEKGPGGAGCTITDTVGDINAFYDDFSQGGWQAWNQLFEPQNNFFGAFILTSDELATRQAIAKEASKLEGVASQGFLSERECLEEGEDGDCLLSKITTPGYVFAEGLAKTSFAELDYIANSFDLEPYAKEIGNTFLDRMLKEIMGFLNMGSSESRPKAPTNDPCAFVKNIFGEEAYEACRIAIKSGKNILDFIQQIELDDIQNAIDYKNQTLDLKQSTLTTLNHLISRLEELLDCQGNNAQTQATITAANQLKTAIEEDILQIENEIIESNSYDAEEIRRERNNAQKENENITELLNEVEADLADCLTNV